MKAKFCLGLLLVSASASSASYIMKVSQPLEVSWGIETSYSDWENTSGLYDCSSWAPATDSYELLQSFTQTRTCKQDRERSFTKSKIEKNSGHSYLIDEGVEPKTFDVVANQENTGTGYKRVQLPDGIKGINFTQMKLSNGSLVSSSRIARMKHLTNKGKTSLWGLTKNVSVILKQEKSATLDQSYYYSLPTTTGMNMPYKFTVKAWTWADDADTGRSLLYSYGGTTTTLYDSGYKNFSGSWQTITKTGYLPSTSNKIRFRGMCKRVAGSYCSAKLENGSIQINYDLPAKGSYVYIK